MRKEDFKGSGCSDFDKIRKSVIKNGTTEKEARFRVLNLYMWIAVLQQRGADLRSFYELDNEYYLLERLVNLGESGSIEKMNQWVDRAYAHIEKVQDSLFENGPVFLPYAEPEGEILSTDSQETGDRENWPMFQRNASNTGCSGDPGAQFGKAAWKFPVSLGWYCRPLVEGDRLYLSSPGMRTTCFCLDSASGEVIWKSGQIHPLFGIYKYPAIMSTPVFIDDRIVLREVNSHGGNDGQARNLVYLDKGTGEIASKSFAGHIDYRTQYAPVGTNGEYVVYPFGVHDIYSSPAVCQNLNRLVCADSGNTEKKWDFNIGDMDVLAEPVLNETTVFQGTTDNYLYAVDLESGKVRWSFQAGAPVNTQVVNKDGIVYFAANDGKCYAIHENDGSQLWANHLEAPADNCRKQFSTLEVHDDRIFFGSVRSAFYCLNQKTGQLIWKSETPDWIRSKPVALDNQVVAACLDGSLVCFDFQGNLLWKKKISSHPILADLVCGNGRIYASDGNLRFFAIDFQGGILWEHSILESFDEGKGNRIFSDTLSGGTYYQSKPTAAEGRVFFGSHAGILYAVDSDSGRELWKFEMGGSISVGAAYYEGRIYAGQQGGERFFYCIDAESGNLIWKKAVPGGWVWGSACVDEGMVYIPTVDGHALCLDGETGHIVWMYRTAKSVPAEPAVDGDIVYFGSWSNTLYAFHKKTGEIVWKQNGISLDSGTLIAFQGNVYVPHHKNIFMAMNGVTGQVVCEGNLDEEAKGEYTDFNASPCFRGDKAYFSTRAGVGLHGVPLYSKLYCVDPATAEIKWIFPDGGGISAPALSEKRLYIASGSMPFLHCLDPERGESLWVYRMGHRMEESTLCVYGPFVYALSSDGFLHAVR